MAEGEGFEPSIPVTRDKRLAGARTRPLCDPSEDPQFITMPAGTAGAWVLRRYRRAVVDQAARVS